MTATEEIEAGLRRLTDLHEIRSLLSRYCRLVDSREPAGIARGAFVEDAVDDHGIYGRAFRGRAEIEAMFTRSNETTDRSAHFVAAPEITIDGDTATAFTYVQGYTWTRASAVQGEVRATDWVFTGMYVDRFARTAEGWLISERRIAPLGPGATGYGARPGDYDKDFDATGGGS